MATWCSSNSSAPPLAALHVAHGLAPDGTAWAEHCAALCGQLNIPLLHRPVAVPAGASLEAQARAVRYAVFEDALRPGEVLFLAHHLDDQVETFMLRLLRGAGLEGLSAMPLSRPLGAGTLVRPLLAYSRAELEGYASDQALTWVDDPSNCDSRHDRNFLRLEVLPLLAGRWPGYRATVARAADHLGAASARLREAAGPLPFCSSRFGDPGLVLEPLLEGGDAQAATRLRAALALWGYRPPDRAMLDEFLRQLRESGAGANPELRAREYTLRRFQEGVFLVPQGCFVADTVSLTPGEVLELPCVGRVQLVPTSGPGLALSDNDRLEVRFRAGGEHCRPQGRAAAPLKKLLQEWQVPPWWRSRLPLLYRGDELLAIADLALCESRCLGTQHGAEERWILTWERPDSGFDD